MIHHLCASLGIIATLWIADAAGAQPVAPPERAGQATPEVRSTAAEGAEVAVDDSGGRDDGGLELRVSALGGMFEGPLFGGEVSAALFSAPQQGFQLGFEAQGRHAVDTDPEGSVEEAALTALTGNLVVRGAHGDFRPYIGVGAGVEWYHYESSFSNTDGSIEGLVYQGFLGTTIDLSERVLLDLRLTVADRDYEETTTGSFGGETIYARDLSFTAGIGLVFRL